MFGVLIEKGPLDWQIFQQQEGRASIAAEGRFALREGEAFSRPTVWLRLVREDSGLTVTGWQKAQMLPENRWKGTLSAPAGGLYRLESCLAEEDAAALEWGVRGDMRHHLGVGDLYVIAGQSNSAGYGKDPFYDPPELGVHLCRNSLRWDLATHPMNDSTESAHPVNTEGANSGASPYLSFAKTLKRELGYPIGLIQTSLGGSPLSRWNLNENGDLYRGMMEAIRAQGGIVKGVLWYQGCSDANPAESASYLGRFAAVVSRFRADMGAQVPWLTVQLNRQLQNGGENVDRWWGQVREAQRQAARIIPGVSVVPSTDCTLSDGIHNSAAANVLLGERLAGAALRDIYGRSYGSPAPDLSEAVLQGPRCIALRFDNVAGRLYDIDSEQIRRRAVTVSDNEGEIPVEEMELAGDTLLVRLGRDAGEGCTVSAGWQQEPPVLMPVDFATHLPILSFFEAEVLSM